MRKLRELQHSAYERLYGQDLPDIQSYGLVLRHKKSGARICLVSNDDNNKVFSIGFRTPPTDGTGVAHIVEHTVLCGSEKYPLKDPFIELEKGSLQTFLNAMTYPDKTVYPIASCNDKDFRNLMDVYLDAVLHPNIYKKKEIFRQEGWHYELESVDDELTINGVVYSEMKGAFSSAEEAVEWEVQKSLYPDTTYGQQSGGDPEEIPELTYEGYLDFHSRYYHPSNSYIYLYGDMDMEEQLTYLDEEYLSHYENHPVDSTVALQAPTGVRRLESEYSVGEDETTDNKTYLTYNTVMGSSLDVKRCIAWCVLDAVLFSAPGAPVKQALIDAGIGSDISSMFIDDILQPMLSVSAKGAEAEQLDRFVEILEGELERLVREGIKETSLLATLNQMEFRYREADFGSYPKGLLYGLNMLISWLYDDNAAFSYFSLNDIYTELRAAIGTGYFESLIREDLLENAHKTIVTVRPVQGLATRKEEALRERLAAYKASLSAEELERLVEETHALRRFQETPDSEEVIGCLPMLEISDIRREVTQFSNVEREIAGVPVVLHEGFTNGIAYLRMFFDVTDLPVEELPYLGLLINVLGYIDTDGHTYSELSDEFLLHTGGLSVVSDTFSNYEHYERFSGKLAVMTKLRYDELANAMALVREMLFSSKLADKKRIREIVFEACSRMRSSMESGGHSSAACRCASYYNAQDYFIQCVKRLTYYDFLKDLQSDFAAHEDEVVEHLQGVLHYVLRKERLLVGIAAEEAGYEKLAETLPELIEAMDRFAQEESPYTISPAQKAPWDGGYPLTKKNEAFTYGGQVQYLARAGNYKAAGLKYHGSMRVARTILALDYLWNNVRVKGGAYGCMCDFSPVNGNAWFVSYRDPQLEKTNAVYEQAAEYMEKLELTERERTKYIIGTISGMDTPLTPKMRGDRAMNLYFIGYPMEELQKERDGVLGATVEDLRAAAKVIRAFLDQDCICAFGGESMLKKNAELFAEVKPLR